MFVSGPDLHVCCSTARQGPLHPHAPTHLGERSYRYDANGNQLGWDNDKNGTRRNIVWDEESRIQSVFDNGHEKSYKYDDQGERVIKRGPQGETAYINQWYTVRNREIASKHVYAGTTRIATSLVPGVKAGSFAPGNGAGNGKGNANGQANAGTGAGTTAGSGDSKLPSTAQQAPGILKGTGIANRSDQAAAHARNLEKNPHYATSGGGTNGDTTAPGTASNQDNFLYYYHPDHLGSSSYVTDAIGKVYEHLEYFPFGETWVQESSNTQRTPYLFTAKELDEETGLYYFGARYYDPRVSVWQSADPILSAYLPNAKNRDKKLRGLGGAFNSPNLALYSYSHLNPVKYVDADGKETQVIITKDYLIDFTVFGQRIKVGAYGSHAAVRVDNPSGKPILYDPAGSYNPVDKELGGPVKGSGDLLEGKPANLNEYVKYQNATGSDVEILRFPTTPAQEKEIADRAEAQGGAAPCFCAKSTSSAISGIGPFKDIEPTMLPGALSDKLKGIKPSPKVELREPPPAQ